jgi:hypothetical protein
MFEGIFICSRMAAAAYGSGCALRDPIVQALWLRDVTG